MRKTLSLAQKKGRKELSSSSSWLAPFAKNSHIHSYTVQGSRSMFWIGAQGAPKARAYQEGPGECSSIGNIIKNLELLKSPGNPFIPINPEKILSFFSVTPLC